MAPVSHPSRWRVVLAFGLVYCIWGSTYLAISIAVEQLPPEFMTGLRYLAAGLVMLAACALTRRRLRLTVPDALRALTIGVLLLSLSNTILSWVELTLPTGLSALIVSVIPLFVVVIESLILGGERLSRRGAVGIPLGVLGILVLIWPKLTAHTALGWKQFLLCLALLGGSACWASGSVISRRWSGALDPFASSGWQMAFAGVLNLGFSFLLGGPFRAVWTLRGVSALLYLVIFGSLIGYGAYIWLLQNVSVPKVATYAYVNPVIAVFLGWWLLHERIDGYILAGSAIILGAVALVTSARVHPPAGQQRSESLPAVETIGD